MSSAQLLLDPAGGTARSARTGEDGRFTFADVGDGEITLVVRRLGFKPASVVLTVGAESAEHPIEISLDAVPSTLEGVEVIGRDSRLKEFYQRRQQHGTGQFMTHEEIEKMSPRYSSDLFRRVPGATLRTGRVGSTIRLRGCRPKVWIDGVPIRDVELDEVMTPGEIAGLEVYTWPGGIPPEYSDRDTRNCGAILVWTRLQ